jgi:peroxiredoxin Q/BCP
VSWRQACDNVAVKLLGMNLNVKKLVYATVASAAAAMIIYSIWGPTALADQDPAASTTPTDTKDSSSVEFVQPEGKKVEKGMKAPDFTLASQTGNTVSLHDYLGKNPVVLYFYPKDETPVCTKEACSFRDNMDTFRDLDATIIGVSADSVESHKKFADKYNLPFILLCDEDNKVRKLYGVPKTLKLMPGRVTYVIDKDGIVKHVFASQLDAEKHVTEAVASLKGADTPK